MALNKKAQGMLFGLMLFVMTFIAAVILTKPIIDMVDIARDVTHLNCDADNISTGVRLTCVFSDLMLPYFFAAVISSGVAFLFIKDLGV